MAWNFRRRIKVIPGIYLNFSKSGVSTSIGIRGANMTFGKNGTYLNTSVPFLGIYNRQKLHGRDPRPQLYNKAYPPESTDNIFSADIHEITSQNMQGIKEAILLARKQRLDLEKDLSKIQSALTWSKIKLGLSYILLYGLVIKSISASLKTDMAAQTKAIEQTKVQIENSYVDLDIEFEPEIREKYDRLTEAFNNLTTCHRIWDVTAAHFQDRVATRSSASTVVNKQAVTFERKPLADIKSAADALCFHNANGADLYCYPSFIVLSTRNNDLAIIGIDEIDIQYDAVRFIERRPVPLDAKIIDHTWVKVNKNGTPDRRFKGNHQIPVVRYGEMRLRTNTGLNEEYLFSNHEYTEEFGEAFREYQEVFGKLVQPDKIS